MFTLEFDHFDWLSQFFSEWSKTKKLLNSQVFCQGSGMWSGIKFDND